jgi:hypothetical protein
MPLPPHVFKCQLGMVSSDAVKFVCCSGMEHMSGQQIPPWTGMH